MLTKMRPSPALIVALIALFVALTGSAIAAGIVPHARLADKAKTANNALKLQGKTAAQVAAKAPRGPAGADGAVGPAGPAGATGPTGPALASAAALVVYKTAPWSLVANAEADFTFTCDSGQKAIGGGFDNPVGAAVAFDTRPTTDGASWKLFLGNLSNSAPASGTLYAICLK
jgi:hypothetical protein